MDRDLGRPAYLNVWGCSAQTLGKHSHLLLPGQRWRGHPSIPVLLSYNTGKGDWHVNTLDRAEQKECWSRSSDHHSSVVQCCENILDHFQLRNFDVDAELKLFSYWVGNMLLLLRDATVIVRVCLSNRSLTGLLCIHLTVQPIQTGCKSAFYLCCATWDMANSHVVCKQGMVKTSHESVQGCDFCCCHDVCTWVW